MAEIKSTLDLVMEKTRNLKFSAEEKRAARLEEAQKAFNGLLQKHLDQELTLEALQTGLADVVCKHDLDDSGVLRKVVLDRLNLETLQAPLLDVLERVFGCKIEPLRVLAGDYQAEMTQRADDRRRELAAFLKTQRQVWGSAVTPNLEGDNKWRDEAATMHELFTMKLEKEKQRL